MLTLHIEANSYDELMKKLAVFLHTDAKVQSAAQEQAYEAGQKVGLSHLAGAEVKIVETGAPRRRGRPSKSEQTPAGASAKGASQDAPEVIPAPQAQVGNSASAQPASPPAEGASAASVPAEAPGTPAPSFDDMKAALQKVAAHQRDGEKDGQAGLMRASQVLSRFGYRKVKEVAEKDFAAVIEKCNAVLAGGEI